MELFHLRSRTFTYMFSFFELGCVRIMVCRLGLSARSSGCLQQGPSIAW
jgi:hypothetical protein